jgi:hypothetical protein
MNSDKFNPINFIEDEDMPSGHLKRFERKLDHEFNKKDLLFNFKTLIAAASIIALFTLGILTASNFKKQSSGQLMLAKYSPDLAETEKYYRNTLNTKIKTIRNTNKIDTDLNLEIKEFQESLKSLSGDMIINPGDERLINAYLGLYQSQIDLLDNIIEQYN